MNDTNTITRKGNLGDIIWIQHTRYGYHWHLAGHAETEMVSITEAQYKAALAIGMNGPGMETERVPGGKRHTFIRRWVSHQEVENVMRLREMTTAEMINMELRQWQRQQGDMRRSMYGGRVG